MDQIFAMKMTLAGPVLEIAGSNWKIDSRALYSIKDEDCCFKFRVV